MNIFGMNSMADNHVILMVKAGVQLGKSTEDSMKDVQLIDDLLTLQRSKSLLNKKRNLKHLLSKRIELEVSGKSTLYNSIDSDKI